MYVDGIESIGEKGWGQNAKETYYDRPNQLSASSTFLLLLLSFSSFSSTCTAPRTRLVPGAAVHIQLTLPFLSIGVVCGKLGMMVNWNSDVGDFRGMVVRQIDSLFFG